MIIPNIRRIVPEFGRYNPNLDEIIPHLTTDFQPVWLIAKKIGIEAEVNPSLINTDGILSLLEEAQGQRHIVYQEEGNEDYLKLTPAGERFYSTSQTQQSPT
jgi:hypothetical protein